MTLNLYQRPTGDEAHLPLDLDGIARNYKRLSRAVGGWYSASFGVQDLPAYQLQSYFNTWIGYVVKESAFGMQAWEGIIYSMQLTLDGAVYEISLMPESWHNNVDVYYSDLAVVDTDQGALSYTLHDTEQGALSYTTEGADDTFTDAGQDFTDWKTTSGDAEYQIDVTNTDGTITWAYLGDEVSNTEILVYTNIGLTTSGWNGQAPAGLTPSSYNVIRVGSLNDAGQDFGDWETTDAGVDSVYRVQVANSDNTTSWGYMGASLAAANILVYTSAARATRGWNGEDTAGKTPEHYEVITVADYGVRRDTDWSANDDSVDEYGEMEYIITLSGSQPIPATALRDSNLTEFAWPRARFIGVADQPDSLTVTCAGFWSTLFWRYWEHSRTAAANTLISDLAGDGEFTTAGRIDANTLVMTADGFPMPQRIADILEWLADKGDAAGNIWKCGIYENRKVIYEQAPTTVDYIWRDGRLLNNAGQAVVPQLLKPGFYVRTESALGAVQPPGTSGVWDDPQVAYVDEVEWSRDDGSLTLSLRNAGPSLIMRRQILAGAG